MAINVVELEWLSIPMDREYPVFEHRIRPLLTSPHALYAFEGSHDAYPHGAMLYIGETESYGVERPLCSAAGRQHQHFYCFREPKKMWGCYWNMVFRWAIPKEPGLTKVLESILISAMKPVVNRNDGWYPEGSEYRDLVVCNKGEKGLLLPVLYGDYFAHE